MKRTTAYPVVAALVVATITGCSVANSSHSVAARPDTVRIVLPHEPPTLEPCDASLTDTGLVVRSNITEPLVERDANTGALEPKLAETWTQTAPTEWRFTIREGVTFSDGSAFDAEDAAASIERAVNSDIGCDVDGYVFGDDELGVAVTGPRTVTVRTPRPDPILPLRISFVEMVPSTTSMTEMVREPVGTGPYRIDYWDYGQRLGLVRNDSYWGPAPAYAHAVYQWRAEGNVRVAMVANGEAEVATALGPDDGAGDLAIAYQNNETTALRIHATEPPLDDYRVRAAIDYAINRAGIVEALFRGLGQPAGQLVAKGVVGFDPDLAPTPYDPDRAADLVAQAKADGVPVEKQIRLIARTGMFPKVDETAEVIQYALSEAGLNVEIQMMDTAGQMQFQARPYPPDAGPILALIQHGNQAGDAQFTVDQYLRSDGYQSTTGTPELDTAITAATRLGGAARQDALAALFATEPAAVRQMAYIAHMQGVLAIAPSVRYRPNPATGDELRIAELIPAGPGADH